MPKFYIRYEETVSGEDVIEADSLEEAKQVASLDRTKSNADWQMLEDVEDAKLVEIFEVDEDFEL